MDNVLILLSDISWFHLSFPPLSSFGASILVDDQSTSTAFGQLAFNPQCFTVYEDPLKPPGQWNNVCTFIHNKSIKYF